MKKLYIYLDNKKLVETHPYTIQMLLIKNIKELNQDANDFLAEFSLPKSNGIIALGFCGLINNELEKDLTLIRMDRDWYIFRRYEKINSIDGYIDFFQIQL